MVQIKRVIKKRNNFPVKKNPKEVYKRKHDELLKSIKRMEVQRTATLFGILNEEYAQLQQRKKKLEELRSAISRHLTEISLNIDELNKTLRSEVMSAGSLAKTEKMVQKLQKELKLIEEARRKLLSREKEVISQLHDAVTKKELGSFKLPKTGQHKVESAETNVLYRLDEATHLLAEERGVEVPHLKVVQNTRQKEKRVITLLSKQLADLKEERSKLLRRKKLLKTDKKMLEKISNSILHKQRELKAKLPSRKE